MDLGPGARETAQNYTAYMTGMSCELRWSDEDPAALVRPPRKSTSPLARSLSPASRTRSILQGQKELMEMVKEMPETYYELSLADLVEKPAPEGQVEGWSGERRDGECPSDGKANLDRSESRKMVQNGSQSHKTRQMAITKSVEDGLLRNLIFPGSSLTSKRRQNSSRSLTVSHTSKVSPRPSFSDDPAKGLDRWKRFSASNKVKHGILEVDLAGGSSNKNSTKNCKNRRDVASKQNFGCCLFSTRKKGTLRE